LFPDQEIDQHGASQPVGQRSVQRARLLFLDCGQQKLARAKRQLQAFFFVQKQSYLQMFFPQVIRL